MLIHAVSRIQFLVVVRLRFISMLLLAGTLSQLLKAPAFFFFFLIFGCAAQHVGS